MVEPAQHPPQVADAVAIGVREAPGIDVVDRSPPPPLGATHVTGRQNGRLALVARSVVGPAGKTSTKDRAVVYPTAPGPPESNSSSGTASSVNASSSAGHAEQQLDNQDDAKHGHHNPDDGRDDRWRTSSANNPGHDYADDDRYRTRDDYTHPSSASEVHPLLRLDVNNDDSAHHSRYQPTPAHRGLVGFARPTRRARENGGRARGDGPTVDDVASGP